MPLFLTMEPSLWPMLSKPCTKKCGIQLQTASVSYPQGNGQAKAANKAISAGLKHWLTNKRGKWANGLPDVLWGYRTTL